MPRTMPALVLYTPRRVARLFSSISQFVFAAHLGAAQEPCASATMAAKIQHLIGMTVVCHVCYRSIVLHLLNKLQLRAGLTLSRLGLALITPVTGLGHPPLSFFLFSLKKNTVRNFQSQIDWLNTAVILSAPTSLAYIPLSCISTPRIRGVGASLTLSRRQVLFPLLHCFVISRALRNHGLNFSGHSHARG